MAEDLFTVDEVAARLQVNPQTVRNWIIRKELEETRVGPRRVRVSQSQLDRFLKLKTEASTAGAARPAVRRKRRRATPREMQTVEDLVETMLSTAASLPVGSAIGRELAESAGRLQLVLRTPRAGDSNRLSPGPSADDPAPSSH